MTNKQLIWNALKEIETATTDPSVGSVDLRQTAWENISKEKQIELRRLLLVNKLIGVVTDKQWQFQLTADGIVAKERHFNRNGNLHFYKSERFRTYMVAFSVTILTVTITQALESLREIYLKRQPEIGCTLQTTHQPNTPNSAKNYVLPTSKK